MSEPRYGNSCTCSSCSPFILICYMMSHLLPLFLLWSLLLWLWLLLFSKQSEGKNTSERLLNACRKRDRSNTFWSSSLFRVAHATLSRSCSNHTILPS